MITRQRAGLTLALILAVGASVQAMDETAVEMRATKLLEEISTNPDSGIPTQFLREAQAIMILPHVVENQLGVGRMKGHGVFLLRDEKGEWGSPKSVKISGISVGAEAGREVTDMVVIYRTRKAADRHVDQSMSLSFSVQALAALHGRHKFSGPKPGSHTTKETLTYRRKSGLIVGARIGGEHWSTPSPASAKSMTSQDADQKADDARVTVKITEGEPPASSARPASDSPETVRLKSVLTSMTTTPEGQVVGTGKTDPKVSQTSDTKLTPK